MKTGNASTLKSGSLSIAMLLLLSNQQVQGSYILDQQQFIKAHDVSFAKTQDTQLVDMTTVGSKMSSLSLSMLDKENTSDGPQENVLLQTETEQQQQNQELLFVKMRQDDLDSGDVMAASATLAADDASTEETKKPAADTATGTEEDLSLSTGGGLMDALMGKDAAEDFSEEHLAQQEAVKKESKKEIAKKLKDAKARSEKKKKKDKEEAAKKKKKSDEKLKKKKEKEEKAKAAQADKTKREEEMLKNFMADESLPKVPDLEDSYLDRGLKKNTALSDLADENAEEQNLAESTKNIVKSAKESMFKGMAGGLGFDLLG